MLGCVIVTGVAVVFVGKYTYLNTLACKNPPADDSCIYTTTAVFMTWVGVNVYRLYFVTSPLANENINGKTAPTYEDFNKLPEDVKQYIEQNTQDPSFQANLDKAKDAGLISGRFRSAQQRKAPPNGLPSNRSQMIRKQLKQICARISTNIPKMTELELKVHKSRISSRPTIKSLMLLHKPNSSPTIRILWICKRAGPSSTP